MALVDSNAGVQFGAAVLAVSEAGAPLVIATPMHAAPVPAAAAVGLPAAPGLGMEDSAGAPRASGVEAEGNVFTVTITNPFGMAARLMAYVREDDEDMAADSSMAPSCDDCSSANMHGGGGGGGGGHNGSPSRRRAAGRSSAGSDGSVAVALMARANAAVVSGYSSAYTDGASQIMPIDLSLFFSPSEIEIGDGAGFGAGGGGSAGGGGGGGVMQVPGSGGGTYIAGNTPVTLNFSLPPGVTLPPALQFIYANRIRAGSIKESSAEGSTHYAGGDTHTHVVAEGSLAAVSSSVGSQLAGLSIPGLLSPTAGLSSDTSVGGADPAPSGGAGFNSHVSASSIIGIVTGRTHAPTNAATPSTTPLAAYTNGVLAAGGEATQPRGGGGGGGSSSNRQFDILSLGGRWQDAKYGSNANLLQSMHGAMAPAGGGGGRPDSLAFLGAWQEPSKAQPAATPMPALHAPLPASAAPAFSAHDVTSGNMTARSSSGMVSARNTVETSATAASNLLPVVPRAAARRPTNASDLTTTLSVEGDGLQTTRRLESAEGTPLLEGGEHLALPFRYTQMSTQSSSRHAEGEASTPLARTPHATTHERARTRSASTTPLSIQRSEDVSPAARLTPVNSSVGARGGARRLSVSSSLAGLPLHPHSRTATAPSPQSVASNSSHTPTQALARSGSLTPGSGAARMFFSATADRHSAEGGGDNRSTRSRLSNAASIAAFHDDALGGGLTVSTASMHGAATHTMFHSQSSPTGIVARRRSSNAALFCLDAPLDVAHVPASGHPHQFHGQVEQQAGEPLRPRSSSALQRSATAGATLLAHAQAHAHAPGRATSLLTSNSVRGVTTVLGIAETAGSTVGSDATVVAMNTLKSDAALDVTHDNAAPPSTAAPSTMTTLMPPQLHTPEALPAVPLPVVVVPPPSQRPSFWCIPLGWARRRSARVHAAPEQSAPAARSPAAQRYAVA